VFLHTVLNSYEVLVKSLVSPEGGHDSQLGQNMIPVTIGVTISCRIYIASQVGITQAQPIADLPRTQTYLTGDISGRSSP